MCPANEKISVRYTPPSRFEEATWSTICKVMGENEEYELYIQISMDSHQPEWIKMSQLLEKTFTELLSDQEFIDICLQMKVTPSKANYKRLGSLITKKSE
jgi:hypothetical protein